MSSVGPRRVRLGNDALVTELTVDAVRAEEQAVTLRELDEHFLDVEFAFATDGVGEDVAPSWRFRRRRTRPRETSVPCIVVILRELDGRRGPREIRSCVPDVNDERPSADEQRDVEGAAHSLAS